MIILKRIAFSKNGTFGVLVKDNWPLCCTCEDPWLNNAPDVSCIPSGTYECRPHSSVKFRDVWELIDVPGRSAILIHAGNSTADTHGCILAGNGFGLINGFPSVLDSVKTLGKLRLTLPLTFTLEIDDFSLPATQQT